MIVGGKIHLGSGVVHGKRVRIGASGTLGVFYVVKGFSKGFSEEYYIVKGFLKGFLKKNMKQKDFQRDFLP